MKKNYLKIALKGNRYSYKEASIQEMGMLGCFLTSEVLCFGSTFKEWALDKTDASSYGGNIIELEKKDNYIILSEQMFEKVKKGPYFAIHQTEFVKLLEIWENICNQNPKPEQVFIIYDGQQLTISHNAEIIWIDNTPSSRNRLTIKRLLNWLLIAMFFLYPGNYIVQRLFFSHS